jgi:hypothetical protein
MLIIIGDQNRVSNTVPIVVNGNRWQPNVNFAILTTTHKIIRQSKTGYEISFLITVGIMVGAPVNHGFTHRFQEQSSRCFVFVEALILIWVDKSVWSSQFQPLA